MQCLSRRVVEKRIVLDALPQRRAPYKVGMKKQSASFRLESRLHIDFDHLSRSETCDRAFLIVVGLAPVADVAAARLFQKQGIYAVIHCEMGGKTCGVGKVDNSHQRMACFQSEQTVVTVYRVDLKDFRIHKADCFFVAAKINIFAFCVKTDAEESVKRLLQSTHRAHPQHRHFPPFRR